MLHHSLYFDALAEDIHLNSITIKSWFLADDHNDKES